MSVIIFKNHLILFYYLVIYSILFILDTILYLTKKIYKLQFIQILYFNQYVLNIIFNTLNWGLDTFRANLNKNIPIAITIIRIKS